MTRARVFALAAFIAIGAAGGSLIVGDTVWFAWSAVLGAIALTIWGRTHDHPQPATTRGHEPLWVPGLNCQLGTKADEPFWVPGLNCHLGDRFPALPRNDDEHRPVWPLPTNHFGAPE